MIKKPQIDVLMKAIEFGLNYSDACRRAKVCRDWFYKKQKSDPKFADQIEDALLAFKFRNIAIIQKAALTHWTASAWLMERKYPEEFAMRTRHELTGAKGQPLWKQERQDIKTLSTEKLEKLIQGFENQRALTEKKSQE